MLGTPAQGQRGLSESLGQSAPYPAAVVAQNPVAQHAVTQNPVAHDGHEADGHEAESAETETEEASLEDRQIFLTGEITDGTAELIISQLLRLDAENPDEDIYLYISSPGGSVYAGMAIYDVMQYIQADVVTISAGFSASMASFLLAAGTPGKRFAFPHARVMIHRPFGGAFGDAEDLEVWTREVELLTNQFYELLSLHTGQSIRRIQRDTERDYYMSASDAVDYGMVDQIMEREIIVEE